MQAAIGTVHGTRGCMHKQNLVPSQNKENVTLMTITHKV